MLSLCEGEAAVVEKVLENTAGLGVVVRIAGGWVRDKLLGIVSDDIDLAIDRMSGEEFALLFPGAQIIHNPEQSKHLASVCIYIDEYSIDVNRLRKEVYQGSSRIPLISLGTPEEDTLRRDFTINSLYYNLTTQNIEDFTGRGISDLESRRICTNIDANVSFTQDPLRILRAIRFASRLSFQLSDDIIRASQTLANLVQEKVSRERIGQELLKMSPNLPQAVRLMQEMRIFSIVFALPAENRWTDAQISKAVDRTKLVWEKCPIEREELIFVVIIWEWAKTVLGKKSVSHWILSNSLKFPSKQTLSICKSLESAVEMGTFSIISLGTALRNTLVPVEEFIQLLDILEIGRYDEGIALMKAHDLSSIREWTPSYNGNDIRRMFNVGGKDIGRLVNLQLNWRIDPQGLSCLEYLRNHV